MQKSGSLAYRWGLSVLALLLASACTKKQEEARPREAELNVEHIQEMIHKKEFDLAESELNFHLQKNPKFNQARVLLASVYLQKADVTIKDYFLLNDIFSQKFDRRQLGFLNPILLESIGEKPNDPLLAALKGINETAIDVAVLQSQMDQIPEIDHSAALNIHRALRVIEPLDQPKDGDRLYRGLVKLIYFKYLWDKGRFLPIGPEKICDLKLKNLNRRLDTIYRYVPLMLEDLSYGVKGNRQSMQNSAANIRSVLEQAQVAILRLGELSRSVSEALSQDQKDKVKCDF
jgi:hypothetical protein